MNYKYYLTIIFALNATFLSAQNDLWVNTGQIAIPPPNNIRNTNSGYVGIGTGAPSAKLHVNDKVLFSKLELTPIRFPGRPAPALKTANATVQLSALSSTSSVSQDHVPLDFNNTFNGTVSLQVLANHRENFREFSINAESPNMPIVLTTQGVERFRIAPNGNIGIGTSNPRGPIHLLQSSSPPSGLPQNENGLLLGLAGLSSYKWIQSYGGVLSLNPQGNNVGIGTTSPQSRLDVKGTTQTEVLVITGGNDIAEPFVITNKQKIIPGAVMVIDHENPGQLRISSEAYDKKVAGVISGGNGINTGISLTQKEIFEDGELIALTGRVFVKANNSNGDIVPGDFLSTSNIPGEAMKVTDHAKAQGAILGKAMSLLDPKTGFVLVLITLQ